MVFFVGAGPGAVDLITVRGKKLLENADLIIYAGSLVNPELLSFAKKGCRIYNSAEMTLEEVVDTLCENDGPEKILVRLHTGDQSIYGAVAEQMTALKKAGINFESVPGVSSFCGAAAALNLEYTLPSFSQSLILTRAEGRTGVRKEESIESFAAHNSSMVIFLSAGLADKVQSSLLAGGISGQTPAAIVYKATWPDQKIFMCTVDSLAYTAKQNGINKTALLIVGKVLSFASANLPVKNEYRSKLYDPFFTTMFREKKGIGIISFTNAGADLSLKIKKELTDFDITLYSAQRTFFREENKKDGIFYTSLESWVKKYFYEYAALIFIGSTGIAVRAVSPFVKSKQTDPAVLSVDEKGKCVIPLLSGHLGGANNLAEKLAAAISSKAFISTATDLNGILSIDTFAKKNNLLISDMTEAKFFSAAFLQSKRALVKIDPNLFDYVDFYGKIPEGVFVEYSSEIEEGYCQALISYKKIDSLGASFLSLYPKCLALGLGCKKGKSVEEIESFVKDIFTDYSLSLHSLREINSIDIKSEEEGIISFAKKINVPFNTFSSELLSKAQGDFSSSTFVKEVTGIDCVCERAALMSCEKKDSKNLIVKKISKNGITAALALIPFVLTFEN